MEFLVSLIIILFVLIVVDFSECLCVMFNWLLKIGMYLLVGMFLFSILGSISLVYLFECYGMFVYVLVLVVLSI